MFKAARWILVGSLLLSTLIFANESPTQDVIIKSIRTIEPFKRKIPWEIDLGQGGFIDIKLSSEWGLPLLDVYINNLGPFKFLVDTGADTSIISNELIATLKLKALETRKTKFNTSTQTATINTSLFLLDEIKIGEAVITNAPVIATNTATDDFQLLKHLNILGILGMNIFHDIVLTLDFGKQKILLSTHKDATISGNKLKLNKSHYIPIVKAKVEGGKKETEYDLLIDTGYSGYIKMPVCFPYDKNKQHKREVISYDVFNEEEGGFISELDGTLVLGDKKLDRPLVKYNLGQCEKRKKWGLIGNAYLQYQTLSIDQKNREVIIH